MGGQVEVVGVDGSPATYTALRWALAHAAAVRGSAGAVLPFDAYPRVPATQPPRP